MTPVDRLMIRDCYVAVANKTSRPVFARISPPQGGRAKSRKASHTARRLVLVLTLFYAGIHDFPAAAAADVDDLTDHPLEELMNVEVSTASKFPQKTLEAPAATTIITAEDIRRYGYGTLADILRSMRGLYISYDRTYDYLGIRGFGRAGDYNSRILLLVDGYRINDPIYDTASIGTEFPIDVDLIDRVEFVRGPGSSIYGSNAVFGIVNVITKSGHDFNGLEVSGEIASYDTDKERLTMGGQLENGLEWLVSGTRYNSEGQDLYFPEFDSPATNNGIARNLDGDHHKKLFTKLGYGNFRLISAYSKRTKEVPTAYYETVFNNPHNETTDGSAFLDLSYYDSLNSQWDASGRIFYGYYRFDGLYPYGNGSIVVNKDNSRAEWWGTELRLTGNFKRHKLLVGAEYQDNFRQEQANFDISPFTEYFHDERSSHREGLYIQDEFTLNDRMILNAGIRYDHYSTVGGSLNPRLGFIWQPVATTALKLLYGTAFRAPNAYELYYDEGSVQKANPNLEPEEVTTYEFVAEHYIQPNFRLIANVYYNEIDNLINQEIDPADGLLVFRNTGDVEAKGVELEAERVWKNGMRLRTSYAWQITESVDTNISLVNSPRHMAKLNLAIPLLRDRASAGLEFQYLSGRKTLAGQSTGDALITNLTLLSTPPVNGLEVSASIYNLFDEDYAHPAAEEHTQDMIFQDGRNFRLKLSYRF